MLVGLQEEWEVIRDEAVAVPSAGSKAAGRQAWQLEAERLHEAGRWTQLQLWQFGERVEKGCEAAPVTCELIERLDTAGLVTGHNIGLGARTVLTFCAKRVRLVTVCFLIQLTVCN